MGENQPITHLSFVDLSLLEGSVGAQWPYVGLRNAGLKTRAVGQLSWGSCPGNLIYKVTYKVIWLVLKLFNKGL